MVHKVANPREKKSYRTPLSLYNWQWSVLEKDAARRGCSGQELIEAILSQYIGRSPYPDEGEQLVPPPDEEED
jgi:hypothetical protein